ncbi:MAG: hypothetical protein J6W09_04455 [Bacteroidales bacterium]|nr:hypothetical protein [Bacteroidales bacterium]
MKTDKELNAELRKPIEGLLKYMDERLEKGLNDDDDSIYEENIYLGFGNDAVKCMAKFYVCPESYEILEDACHKIIQYIDEEYPKDEPIGRIVKSYKFEDNCGNISVQGHLTNGGFFVDFAPTDYYFGSFGVWKDEESFMDDDSDAIYCINPNESKWLLMWEEILDDYAKKNGEYVDRVDEWKKAVYEKVVK